jgi:fatty-acyl-CoA synthase
MLGILVRTQGGEDMIIWGHENIYPREIKELLYAHLAVPDIQVIGVPDKKYGRNW